MGDLWIALYGEQGFPHREDLGELYAKLTVFVHGFRSKKQI